MIHENVPWRLAIIHASDWLAKLLVVRRAREVGQ
jgi:hypothetical protein